MKLTVNAEQREVPEGTTLAGLIALVGLDAQPCAAEVNEQLVPKREHDARTLHDGDRVELVTLVGGG
jgi:sulfur carrier protein